MAVGRVPGDLQQTLHGLFRLLDCRLVLRRATPAAEVKPFQLQQTGHRQVDGHGRFVRERGLQFLQQLDCGREILRAQGSQGAVVELNQASRLAR